MQANNLFRALLASDVLSGRRHEVPWRELASTQFSAENETKSWELLRDWAEEHDIEYGALNCEVTRETTRILNLWHLPIPAANKHQHPTPLA